jgi:hypothetical protein
MPSLPRGPMLASFDMALLEKFLQQACWSTVGQHETVIQFRWAPKYYPIHAEPFRNALLACAATGRPFSEDLPINEKETQIDRYVNNAYELVMRCADTGDARTLIYSAYMLSVYEHCRSDVESSSIHCLGMQDGIAMLKRNPGTDTSEEEMALLQILGLNSLRAEYLRVQRDKKLTRELRNIKLYELLKSTSKLPLDEWIPIHPSAASLRILCLSNMFEIFSHHYILKKAGDTEEQQEDLAFVHARLEYILNQILLLIPTIPETIETFGTHDLGYFLIGPFCCSAELAQTDVPEAFLLRACLHYSATIVKYTLLAEMSPLEQERACEAAISLAFCCSMLRKHGGWAPILEETISCGFSLSALILYIQSKNVMGILVRILVCY